MRYNDGHSLLVHAKCLILKSITGLFPPRVGATLEMPRSESR